MFKKAQQRRDLESDLNSEKATEEADGGAIRSSESDEYDASPSVGAAQKASSDIGESAAEHLTSSLYFPCPLLPRSHPHAARMFSSLPRRRMLTVPHSPRSAWSAAAIDFKVIWIVSVDNQASDLFFQFFVHSFPSIAYC